MENCVKGIFLTGWCNELKNLKIIYDSKNSEYIREEDFIGCLRIWRVIRILFPYSEDKVLKKGIGDF